MNDEKDICRGCNQIIDPKWCWCGSNIDETHEGHSFIPMGCICNYHKGATTKRNSHKLVAIKPWQDHKKEK